MTLNDINLHTLLGNWTYKHSFISDWHITGVVLMSPYFTVPLPWGLRGHEHTREKCSWGPTHRPLQSQCTCMWVPPSFTIPPADPCTWHCTHCTVHCRLCRSAARAPDFRSSAGQLTGVWNWHMRCDYYKLCILLIVWIIWNILLIYFISL